MKALHRTIFCILLCLLLSCLIGFASAEEATAAEAVSPAPAVTEDQIIQAAQPLIRAQSREYRINALRVDGMASQANADGTYTFICDLTMNKTLLEQSVEQLPHIQGLLKGLDLRSADDCASLCREGFLPANPTVFTPDLVLALQTQEFISEVDSCIGVANDISYPLSLRVSAAGEILAINGRDGMNNPVPLSDYYPLSHQQMYDNGLQHAAFNIAQAPAMCEQLNYLILS